MHVARNRMTSKWLATHQAPSPVQSGAPPVTVNITIHETPAAAPTPPSAAAKPAPRSEPRRADPARFDQAAFDDALYASIYGPPR